MTPDLISKGVAADSEAVEIEHVRRKISLGVLKKRRLSSSPSRRAGKGAWAEERLATLGGLTRWMTSPRNAVDNPVAPSDVAKQLGVTTSGSSHAQAAVASTPTLTEPARRRAEFRERSASRRALLSADTTVTEQPAARRALPPVDPTLNMFTLNATAGGRSPRQAEDVENRTHTEFARRRAEHRHRSASRKARSPVDTSVFEATSHSVATLDPGAATTREHASRRPRQRSVTRKEVVAESPCFNIGPAGGNSAATPELGPVPAREPTSRRPPRAPSVTRKDKAASHSIHGNPRAADKQPCFVAKENVCPNILAGQLQQDQQKTSSCIGKENIFQHQQHLLQPRQQTCQQQPQELQQHQHQPLQQQPQHKPLQQQQLEPRQHQQERYVRDPFANAVAAAPQSLWQQNGCQTSALYADSKSRVATSMKVSGGKCEIFVDPECDSENVEAHNFSHSASLGSGLQKFVHSVNNVSAHSSSVMAQINAVCDLVEDGHEGTMRILRQRLSKLQARRSVAEA